MPYIEKSGVSTIKDQLEQWKGVMHDPNIDGFNGWACKQKILKVLWAAQEALVDSPEYAGQEEWIKEQEEALKHINEDQLGDKSEIAHT